MRPRSRALVLAAVLALAAPGVLQAQGSSVLIPPDSLEYLLGEAPFELPDTLVGTRFAEDRTQRVPLWFDDGAVGVVVKWAPAPRGGEAFNNVPRYEIAAYELQKLFLPGPEYVVPPTIPRMFPLDWYGTVDGDVRPTFGDAQSVLVVLQYFLFNVSDEDVFDEDRFEADSVYARHWANVNLLTHFVDHKDANKGNLLISMVEGSPRVFAVDNGVAFGSERSDRGSRWGDLQVDRFPRRTVERLMAVTEERLRSELGVLAQYERRGDQLVRVEPEENWRPSRGIREEDEGVQIGLTEREIDRVWDRIESFLDRVREGRLGVF